MLYLMLVIINYLPGSRSNWKCLCEELDVNYENLLHLNPTERMLNIFQQYQQQNEDEVTVKMLYKALKSISAIRAASLLLQRAKKLYEQPQRTASESQMHSGRKAPPIQTSHSMPHTSMAQMVIGEDAVCFREEHCDVTTVGVTNASISEEMISLASTENPLNV